MILQMTRPVQGGLKQERKLDIISNHIANSSVNGFKKDILSFDEKMDAIISVDVSQGDIVTTGNKLDLALGDEGFFTIETQRGIRYTRDGNFSLNIDGELITQNGDLVLGEDGPILIEGDDIHINEAGEIYVDGEYVDSVRVSTFQSFDKLYKEGSSLYAYKGDEKEVTMPLNIVIKQKALELSNVSVVSEMTDMIQSHRVFETYQKVIQTLDEIDNKAIVDVGKP